MARKSHLPIAGFLLGCGTQRLGFSSRPKVLEAGSREEMSEGELHNRFQKNRSPVLQVCREFQSALAIATERCP